MPQPIHATIPVDTTTVVFRNHVSDSSNIMLCVKGRDFRAEHGSPTVRPGIIVYDENNVQIYNIHNKPPLDEKLNFIAVRVPAGGRVEVQAQFHTDTSGIPSRGEVDYAVFPFGGV